MSHSCWAARDRSVSNDRDKKETFASKVISVLNANIIPTCYASFVFLFARGSSAVHRSFTGTKAKLNQIDLLYMETIYNTIR